MKKIRSGYYSESLLFLPGRLHVSRHGATLELTAKDSQNRRRMFSLSCDNAEKLADELWNDWQSLKSSKLDRIFLFDDCFPITSEGLLQGICEELRYSFERSRAITSLLFAEDDSPTDPDRAPTESTESVSKHDDAATDRGYNINLEKAPAAGDSIFGSSPNLGDIIESLLDNARNKEEDALSKYTDDFSNLKYNSYIPYAGMGKAILLLSVMYLISSQIIKSTKVPIGLELEKTYDMLWKQYVSRNVHNMYSSYEQSFIDMAEEDFWRLMKKHDQESVTGFPLSSYKCAVIDQALYEIMKDSDRSAILKSTLIDKYL